MNKRGVAFVAILLILLLTVVVVSTGVVVYSKIKENFEGDSDVSDLYVDEDGEGVEGDGLSGSGGDPFGDVNGRSDSGSGGGGGGGSGGGNEVGGGSETDGNGEAQVLIPGDGWIGQTEEPGPIGSGPKAIAHWDVVPYQTFSGVFEVGVVAFHKNGIDRVEFSVDNGPWVSVEEMTFNSRTGVVEYWVKLDASLFSSDGEIEVRAIAYPNSGQPRLLSYNHEFTNGPEVFGLKLSANAGGTLAGGIRYVDPGESIAATVLEIQSVQGGDVAGGIVYLNSGDHVLDSANINEASDRWLTISGAPGTGVGDVRIVERTGGGFEGALIKIQDLTLKFPATIDGTRGVWAKGIIAQGDGVDDAGYWHQHWHLGWTEGVYTTESTFRDLRMPIVKSVFMRNLLLENIGEDIIRDSRFVVNIESHDNGYLESHSDFTQWYLPDFPVVENIILYNVKSYDAAPLTQGIYVARDVGEGYEFNNAAFVNILIDRVEESFSLSQWREVKTNHLLLWHVTQSNIQFSLLAEDVTDLSVKGNVWEKFGLGANAVVNEGDFESNHYGVCDFYLAYCGGSDVTTGDPGFSNLAGNDFSPGVGSVLIDRVQRFVVGDANNEIRGDLTASGSLKWESESESMNDKTEEENMDGEEEESEEDEGVEIGGPTSGLIGYWNFEGGVEDQTGNGYDGTILEGASIVNEGKTGQGLFVDGVDDDSNAVSLSGHEDDFDFTGELTISSWVRVDDLAAHHGIFAKGGLSQAPSAEQYGLRFYEFSPRFQFTASDGTTRLNAFSPKNEVSIDIWYHVVGVFDGTEAMIYVNWELAGSDNNAEFSGVLNSASGLGIGGDFQNLRQYFWGEIDELRVYNRALSGTEIQELYDLDV